MSKKTCLFASYTRSTILPNDVKHYLKALYDCGWETHLALSGQTILSEDTEHFCKQHRITPHLRPNEGLDFGAWQALMQKNVTRDADHILLTNDSIFGPLYPMETIFSQRLNQPIDVWGMVETLEINWHFQSWFLCFTNQAFHHEKIQELFNLPFKDMPKPQIIQKGELGLGRILQQIPNFNYVGQWSKLKKYPLRDPRQTNPMHMDWYSVIASGQVPFIKKEVIRDNYFGLFWLNYYRTLLKDNTYFPLGYVDDYLRQFPNRPLPVVPKWKRFLYLISTYDTKLAWKYFLKQGVACPIISPPGR
ncbi:Lipopolysaccharide biosynthesis protein (RgpF) [Commensalibacter communis]|uniref:Lipopolysaccharide biosynthesis protein (RgpF) n=1 Tax=Commensalibacter communis TaxID=2972786 RepID=A0A9W4XIE0_9PROT|nr:rhamnan synthesis F family protein [Commensalibacter communis]CAI3950699.1 Lipopolysaccharide biosynthesis protein (RgpF) [Commensalibacter communis]CAI3952388.1 Lipopolysaccharide biosynthesis protein (RgpF) [Commensalibacter communis]CAI3954650.1 Lipopolysaccharide biosynthesis protein (RgpF) [Commensalibacter communis]CAI3954784.1 Lipopolysaccharide biosynthesis protein (RgpF) [Commensalibacter communis]CAI3954977.1 Lipopolysaccharide biosynthesis protein (RgpF) [Commensalibacter communi